MSDLPTLAGALATAINTAEVVGQPGVKLRTAAYLSDTFSAPCALIGVNAVDRSAGGRNARFRFLVYLILPRTSDRAGLAAMEAYMSPGGNSSLWKAIETDPTLGGVAGGAHVVKCGPPAAIKANGNPYFGCSFMVELYADL